MALLTSCDKGLKVAARLEMVRCKLTASSDEIGVLSTVTAQSSPLENSATDYNDHL